MKKVLGVFLAVMILGLSVLPLGGCAEKKNKGPVTVNIWIMPNSLEPTKDLENIIAEFEKENPNIKIKITSVDWGAAWTKITTAATSKDVPDIVQLGSTWVGAISSMGALWDLSKKIDELGGEGAFVPAGWQSHGIVGAGQVTAVPWIVDVRAMYYRTDVFKRLGLNADSLSTWDSFEKTLEKLKSAKLVIDGVPIAPLGLSGKNDWNVIHNLAPWIWAGGGDFLSADNNQARINDGKAVNGIKFYIDLVKKGYVPIEYLELNSAQVSSNFNQGACAIYFDGPYEVKTLTTPPQQGGAAGGITARNFNVAPYPAGKEGRFCFVGGSNLAIFKASPNKEEAWLVIKHLLKPESQIAYSKVTGFLPSVKQSFEDPYFTSNPQRKIFKEAVQYGKTYPCIPAWGVLEPILTRRFGIMWDRVTEADGPVDVNTLNEQLNLAADEINAVLQQAQ